MLYFVHLLNNVNYFMRTGIIIQARSGSRRLKNKIFEKIYKKTIIEHVIFQVKKTNFKKIIIVATSKNKKDRKILKYTKKEKVNFFSGPESNVLKRFYQAAKFYKLDIIIRISADSPLIDYNIINDFYKIFKKHHYSYVSNLIKRTYPKGMSVEIFDFKMLEKLYKKEKSKFGKEHVTSYIIKNHKNFKTKNITLKNNFRNINLSVDTKEDLEYCKKVYKRITNKRKFYLNKLLKIAKNI